MEILQYEFNGEGMHRVFENEKWTVGIKNWKPANDITGLDCLERHNLTDELFVLIQGSCTLIYANETDGKIELGAVKMEPNRVYNIFGELAISNFKILEKYFRKRYNNPIKEDGAEREWH